MNRFIKVFGFIAVAAITVIGCANDIEAPVKEYTHTVLIHAGQPDTRTLINEGVSSASFIWSSDDDTRLYLTETGVAGTDISIATKDAYSTITLSATFSQAEPPANYTYAGFLSKNKTAAPFPKIPTAQTSTATSYDPDADILVAKAVSFGSAQDELSLQFARPVVINKMTLKGLDEGETISSILVSADKDITGYYNTSTNAWSGQSSEITISTAQSVPASGQVTVYFVTMPVEDVTLTVTVTTGNYIYSKTFGSTIDFIQDQVTVFSVNSLAKAAKADYSGTYVITNTAGTKMANVWDSGNNLPAVDVVLDGGVIYYDPDAVTLSSAQVTLTKITDTESTYYGMYTILQNSKYLYAAASDKNYLKAQADINVNAYWEVSCTDGNWSIVASKSSNNNVMQYNGTNVIFSCYASASQTAVALYGITANVKPTPVITAVNIDIASDAVASTNTGATFNSNTSTVAATAYNDSGLSEVSDWLTASVAGTTVSYSATANSTGASRTGYIKITATNSDSRNVVKTITVTQAAAGGPVLRYTLSATVGSDNGYATAEDIEVNKITWNVTGNSTYAPWRLGGKSISNTDRAIYSKEPISANISQIVITNGASSGSITVNSMKVYVCSTAAGAKAGTPTDVVASFTPSYVEDDDVTINKADDTSWANCYYRIVYNVTVSGSKNKYIEFSEAKFYE